MTTVCNELFRAFSCLMPLFRPAPQKATTPQQNKTKNPTKEAILLLLLLMMMMMMMMIIIIMITIMIIIGVMGWLSW